MVSSNGNESIVFDRIVKKEETPLQVKIPITGQSTIRMYIKRPIINRGDGGIAMHINGVIGKLIAGFYYVYDHDGNIYECRARGVFRKDDITPLVGDNVVIVEKSKGSYIIDKILPRKIS